MDEPEVDHPAAEFAEIDALLARSSRFLSGGDVPPRGPREDERLSVLYDLDWNEDARLAEWRQGVDRTSDLPVVLGAALTLDAWRRAHSRADRLAALIDTIREAAAAGLKQHDRLLQAKERLERLLRGRRASSRLPRLLDLMLSRTLVSTCMIQQTLNVSRQGALNLVAEFSLRELTGRGSYRAWEMV